MRTSLRPATRKPGPPLIWIQIVGFDALRIVAARGNSPVKCPGFAFFEGCRERQR
jgi:hypothetical protein